MNRLKDCLAALRDAGRKALIPYITAGDPHPGATVGIMHALVAAGADVIEVGVPFSDPMADGPVIQSACERALQHGTSMADVLDMITRFRADDAATPIVIMTYLNPVERIGHDAFAARARAAGVDGILAVDLSADEAPDVLPALTAQQLDPITLVAPTTSEQRMAQVCAHGAGFIYYVSLKGVTGADRIAVDELAGHVDSIRRHSDLPVAVGFGVRTPAIAAAVAEVADGVVVGSALVQEIARHRADETRMLEAVAQTLRSMREAMDAQTVEGEEDA